jgi:hypothetical protein
VVRFSILYPIYTEPRGNEGPSGCSGEDIQTEDTTQNKKSVLLIIFKYLKYLIIL